MDSALGSYGSLLIHIVVCVALALTTWIASLVLGRVGTRTGVKDVAYECGMLPEKGAQPRFSVKFYLVAMLFILFDNEAIFLYPWAVVYKQLKMFAFLEMLLFVAFILAGFFFIWKKGVLDWAETDRLAAKRIELAAKRAERQAA